MDPSTDHQASGLIQRARLLLRKKLGVFLVFAGIATALWFLQALDRTYVAVIENPVVFKNLPEEKVLITNLPKKLSLEIEGSGFSILRHNWDLSKQPVQIDFSNLTTVSNESLRGKWVRITLSSYRQKMAQQFNNFQIISLSPDTLNLGFATMIEKRIEVTPKVVFELSKGVMLASPVKTDPEFVTLTGPDLLLDTITKVYTQELNLKRIQETVVRKVFLETLPEEINVSENNLSLIINVESFTEKTLKVEIEPVNLADSMYLKTFPSRVNLTFNVILSQFESVSEKDFQAVVDYRDHQQGTKTLKVKLLRQPPFIGKVRISPESVDYIIER